MITISTTLYSLQNAAVAILAADDFYNGNASANQKKVPIIVQQHGDIQQQIDLCLGQVGICALVMVPTFQLQAADKPDLSGTAALTIGIYESPTLNQENPNGTNIAAIELVERTVCILHYAPHGLATGPVATEPTSATKFLAAPATPIELASQGPPLWYNISFQAHVTLNAIYQ
jgi:hypothetical protein